MSTRPIHAPPNQRDVRPTFTPRVSLHAAARSAQTRGEDLCERDMLANAAEYRRALHHVLRLFFASDAIVLVDARTGVFANPARTRALIVIEGVVVTVLRARVDRGFNDKRLRMIGDRLREKRERGACRERPWWQQEEQLATALAA